MPCTARTINLRRTNRTMPPTTKRNPMIVRENGQWVWVKYNFLKQKKELDTSLRPDLKGSIESRFGAIQEVVCQEVIGESLVEQQLNNLLLNAEDPSQRNPEEDEEVSKGTANIS